MPETNHLTALDAISEWRAWQTLSIIYTIQLNRQIQRRWLLEQASMQDKPLSERFRPLIFLEPVPTLSKQTQGISDIEMATVRTEVALLRARVEKGKELASEIERRMLQPRIRFPTHFCHTCVEDGERVEVLLTKCGHRVCRVCLEYATEAGVYECGICFKVAQFVTRTPSSPIRGPCPAPVSFLQDVSVMETGNGRKASSREVKSCSAMV